jgi:ribosomal subunit interface protein
MTVPLQVTFQDMESSDALSERIEERAKRLERFHDRITSCRVVVARPHRHHRKGSMYSVHIDVSIPGREVVVQGSTGENEDVYIAVHDAFDAAQRQLRKINDRKREVRRATSATL